MAKNNKTWLIIGASAVAIGLYLKGKSNITKKVQTLITDNPDKDISQILPTKVSQSIGDKISTALGISKPAVISYNYNNSTLHAPDDWWLENTEGDLSAYLNEHGELEVSIWGAVKDGIKSVFSLGGK